VLGQSLRDFELVLVDNGTALAADTLGEVGADARIRWVRLGENRGIADGYAVGVAAARSAHIALLDYDDLMLPHRLERQLTILMSRPELGLLGSGATTIDENGRPVGHEFCLVNAAEHRIYSAYHSGALMPSMMGRTEVFREIPFRAAFRWSSDFDFITRVAERHSIAAVPEVLLHYRRHSAQTTRAHRVSQVFEECHVRLLCARRRSGWDERFEETVTGLQGADVPTSERAIHARFGRRFLAEGFFEQAVYQARRLLVTGHDVGSAVEALRVLSSCLRRAPRQAVLLSRLFFRGPVHAYRLRNIGPSLRG
jgi:glycosyltransferase involved in cell wall biosynthesis